MLRTCQGVHAHAPTMALEIERWPCLCMSSVLLTSDSNWDYECQTCIAVSNELMKNDRGAVKSPLKWIKHLLSGYVKEGNFVNWKVSDLEGESPRGPVTARTGLRARCCRAAAYCLCPLTCKGADQRASCGEPAEDAGVRRAARASHGAHTQRASAPAPGPAVIRKAEKSQELPLHDPLTPSKIWEETLKIHKIKI